MPRVAWSAYQELRNWPNIRKLLKNGKMPGLTGWSHNSWSTQQSPLPNATFPLQTAKELRQHYFAAVSYTDEQVGRVLTALDEGGYAKNTIVILFGDHGWYVALTQCVS